MGTKLMVFVALLNCVNTCFAQINGTVVDSQTAKPIWGVHVITDNDSTITNSKGEFKLSGEISKLTFSYLGYQKLTLTNREISNPLIVTLRPFAMEIEQINIRGFLNQHPIMQIPSNIGYIQNISTIPSDGISYIENLNIVPGIFAHTGGLNTNRIVIRGIGSRTPYGTNRIKAYYKDIPLTTGDGTTEIEDLNNLDIGPLEVLKGSKSALYGWGLGGVIRINEPEYISTNHITVQANAAAYQTYKAALGIQMRKKRWLFRTNLSNSQTNGWRQNSQYQRLNSMFNVGFEGSEYQISILLLTIKTKANIPSSINQKMFAESPESAAPNWYSVQGYEDYDKLISGVSYNHSFSDKWSNKLSLFAQNYSGYESRPFNILEDKATKIGCRDIISYKWKEITIQTGIETLFESYSWDIYKTIGGEQGEIENRFSEKRQPISVFFNGQLNITKQLVVEAGISINTLKYKLQNKMEDISNAPETYSYGMVYSPYLGINFPVNRYLRIYSSISNGYSAPSVEETLLPEGSINLDLKPESGLNTEIGLRFHDKNKRIFADMCIYSIWVSNLLVTKRETEEIFYGDNAGKTWHRGIELSSTIKVNHTESTMPLSINISYNWIHASFIKYIDDGINYSGHSLPGIPNQNLFLMAHAKSKWGGYMVSTYQFVGKQYMDDLNLNIANDYQLVHVKAGITRKLNLLEFDFIFGIRNVLNKHYASMILVNAPSFSGSLPRYYYPGMPRNYFIGATITF